MTTKKKNRMSLGGRKFSNVSNTKSEITETFKHTQKYKIDAELSTDERLAAKISELDKLVEVTKIEFEMEKANLSKEYQEKEEKLKKTIEEQQFIIDLRSEELEKQKAKRLEMTSSRAGTIKIYGSAAAAGNKIGNVKLENNVIDDFGFFSVTNFESTVNNCTFVNTRIVNNTFNNSFTCPFYVTDSEGKKYEFISSTGRHEGLYIGNHGQCPIDSTQLVTKLPYRDGAYKDADNHEWPLDLTHTFRMFIPGERLFKGTVVGAKMVEMFTSYGSDTQVINPINYGLFHVGSLDASDNDYCNMCLANDFPAVDATVITFINIQGV